MRSQQLFKYNIFQELDHESIRQYGSFFDYDDTLFDGVKGVIGVFEMIAAIDAHIIAYPAILVHNRVADIAARPDTDGWQPMYTGMFYFLDRLIKIDPHYIAAHDGSASAD